MSGLAEKMFFVLVPAMFGVYLLADLSSSSSALVSHISWIRCKHGSQLPTAWVVVTCVSIAAALTTNQ
jgi:hypothetical protein